MSDSDDGSSYPGHRQRDISYLLSSLLYKLKKP
jgi:hypothetical protein